MREIGGYIELDRYSLPMLHEGAIALNCGRNALAYVLRAKGIRKIRIPRLLCASVKDACDRENAKIRYYSIGPNFLPEADVDLQEDEWLYIVNYYGQIDNNCIAEYKKKYQRIIVDNAQAYFQEPVVGVDTLYTCRKFFGVADGAFLYTNATMSEQLEREESFDRMRFLLGRFERTASEFYGEYTANNSSFSSVPIRTMSCLTDNLLRAICYEKVKAQRTENFRQLHERFSEINRLCLTVPEGAFMYPLYLKNGLEVRKRLQAKKIYIPTLWPDVFKLCGENEIAYDLAKNILPLPVDQRYGASDMQTLITEILDVMSKMV